MPFVCRKHHGRTFKPLVLDIAPKPKKVVRDNGLFNLLDIDSNDQLIVDEVFGMFKQGDKNGDYKLDS